MATRSHTTFQKRQKELARMEKQRDKAARKAQRKLAKQSNPEADDMELDPELSGEPEILAASPAVEGR